jgi:hypothetical protein
MTARCRKCRRTSGQLPLEEWIDSWPIGVTPRGDIIEDHECSECDRGDGQPLFEGGDDGGDEGEDP